MKTIKIRRFVFAIVSVSFALCAPMAFAADSAEQLAKGIELYNKNKSLDAIDYFIDVMLKGTREEIEVANKYVDMIHNELGGIKNPVDVTVNYGENAVKYGENAVKTWNSSLQKQTAAQQSWVENQIDDIMAQNAAENDPSYAQGVVATTVVEENSSDTSSLPSSSTTSAFVDLTTPDAIEARNLYTEQKIASMLQAAIDKLSNEKGVHLYLRDGYPDAIDIDDGVVFEKGNFRPESLPLLNNIYELLALTQGAEYVILPPGSYTDDVTLSGIREAMALNSYLVKRGISQGKLYYNMGLVDKEAPAQFANLKGLSIVFDYDSKFPARLTKNAENETNPLLSIAIVPQCHAIDRSLGEAYAIDFSVLETVNGLDNWVLQIVQHGRDGNYYIVRQLEGFAPVYHQILWNGRKGIIGPELPCGKYTIVLTATDLQGNKQTLRRRVVVKCNSSQSDNITAFCGTKSALEETTSTKAKELNYKASRLWKKPGRKMGGYSKASVDAAETATSTAATDVAAASSASSEDSSTYTVTKTVTNIVTEDTSAPITTGTNTSSSYSSSSSSSSYGSGSTSTSGYSSGSDTSYEQTTDLSTANPYDMPYDEDL